MAVVARPNQAGEVQDDHHDSASEKHKSSTLSLDEEAQVVATSEAKNEAPSRPGPPVFLTPDGKPAGPPPDGGLTAWLQVLGAWMLFFNTWGILNT